MASSDPALVGTSENTKVGYFVFVVGVGDPIGGPWEEPGQPDMAGLASGLARQPARVTPGYTVPQSSISLNVSNRPSLGNLATLAEVSSTSSMGSEAMWMNTRSATGVFP